MFSPAQPEFGTQLVALAAEQPELLGLLHADPSAQLRLMGVGESYAAWALQGAPTALPEEVRASGAGALAVRVPHRAEAELPRGMEAEFIALGMAPPGVGPVPVCLTAAAETPFGRSLLVQSVVPGRVVPDSSWTPALLVSHARQLAALHARRYAAHGALDVAPSEHRSELSPHQILRDALTYWENTRPDLLEETAAGKLAGLMEPFLYAAAPAFEGIEFALVHGDSCAANILVDGGQVRYVDWEWSEIGDPARDLALLGAPFGASPWYLKLDPQRELTLVSAYVAAGGAAGNDNLERLLARRRVHEVIEQLFNAVYFLGRLKPSAGEVPPSERQRPVYERAVREMFRSVQQRLLHAARPPTSD